MRYILGILALVLLAACETPVSVPTYADITFTHRPKIALDVAKITVVEAYQNTTASPHVETEFPVSPLQMAKRWAKDRLEAVGTSGELVFTIRDASVLEVPLEKSTGLTGLVTVDQGERYDAKLAVDMKADDPAMGRTASSSTMVERSQTVAEDVTLNERKAAWYDMTAQMARDLDPQLDDAIRQYFKAFVKP